MASNSKFAIAIHTAGVIAVFDGKPVASQMIAGSVKTNPVVIRRIIGNLVKYGLVEVQMGTGGGSRLARPPEEITLADIYLAIGEEGIFEIPTLCDSHGCDFGRTVRPILQEVLTEAENGLIERLRAISLAQVLKKVRALMPKDCFTEPNNGREKG